MLKKLTIDNDLDIIAAYGSSKDIQIYTSINIPASKIYIIGRSNRKLSTSCTVSFKILHFGFFFIVDVFRF